MSDESRFDLAGAVRREWWLVLLVAAVAVIVTMVATSGGVASYTGSATVYIDYPAVNKFPPLFYGDRMLELIQSPEFYEALSEKTGIPVEDIEANMRTSAQGKFLDKLAIRYTTDSEAEAKEATDKLALAVVEYAGDVGAVETDRQAAVIVVNEAAVERMKSLLDEVRAQGDAYQEADLVSKLALLEAETINTKSALEAIEGAYTYGGDVSVDGGTASNLRIDAIAGALLAGLIAGIGIAALREWWTLRRAKTV